MMKKLFYFILFVLFIIPLDGFALDFEIEGPCCRLQYNKPIILDVGDRIMSRPCEGSSCKTKAYIKIDGQELDGCYGSHPDCTDEFNIDKKYYVGFYQRQS